MKIGRVLIAGLAAAALANPAFGAAGALSVSKSLDGSARAGAQVDGLSRIGGAGDDIPLYGIAFSLIIVAIFVALAAGGDDPDDSPVSP